MDDSCAIELPIDGTLDLHTFHPRELKGLIPDYLTACRGQGVLTVRIIHGKGTGVLRRRVHSILSQLAEVSSYHLAGEGAGEWGATIAKLKPLKNKNQTI